MSGKSWSLSTYDNHDAIRLRAHRNTDTRWRDPLKVVLVLLLLWSLHRHPWSQSPVTNKSRPRIPLKGIPPRLEVFQDCSTDNLLTDTNLNFLSTAHPIQLSEFVSRREHLAQALVADGIDAFVVEPGYTFQYYANVRSCHSLIPVFCNGKLTSFPLYYSGLAVRLGALGA